MDAAIDAASFIAMSTADAMGEEASTLRVKAKWWMEQAVEARAQAVEAREADQHDAAKKFDEAAERYWQEWEWHSLAANNRDAQGAKAVQIAAEKIAAAVLCNREDSGDPDARPIPLVTLPAAAALSAPNPLDVAGAEPAASERKKKKSKKRKKKLSASQLMVRTCDGALDILESMLQMIGDAIHSKDATLLNCLIHDLDVMQLASSIPDAGFRPFGDPNSIAERVNFWLSEFFLAYPAEIDMAAGIFASAIPKEILEGECTGISPPLPEKFVTSALADVHLQAAVALSIE